MFGDFLRRPRWTMEKRHAWICIRSFKMFGKNPRTLSQMDPNDWFDGAKQKITFNKSKYVGTFLHEKDANNGMIDQINYQAWHYYIAVAGFLQPTILFNQILWRSFGDFKGHRFGVFWHPHMEKPSARVELVWSERLDWNSVFAITFGTKSMMPIVSLCCFDAWKKCSNTHIYIYIFKTKNRHPLTKQIQL